MSFSQEWEQLYQENQQEAIWPWSHLVSLAHHFGNLHKGMRVLELGCGAGANIPFFLQQGADYYGVDGSPTTVIALQKRFAGKSVHIEMADFTKLSGVHSGGAFDLILDRSALTCNTTEDIEHTISFIWKNLASHGRFFGLDWQSTKHDDYHQQEGAYLDAKTRVFQTGHFAGMGAMHFVDQNDLARLFRGGRFLYLTEKIEQHYMPDRHQSAAWDFVVEKAEGTDE